MDNKKPTRESKAARQAKWKALDKAAACVPTTWLHPLLSGRESVISNPPWGGPDIEALLRRIRNDILGLKT